jgi:hypothetical protein
MSRRLFSSGFGVRTPHSPKCAEGENHERGRPFWMRREKRPIASAKPVVSALLFPPTANCITPCGPSTASPSNGSVTRSPRATTRRGRRRQLLREGRNALRLHPTPLYYRASTIQTHNAAAALAQVNPENRDLNR